MIHDRSVSREAVAKGGRRIEREAETVAAMIGLFCRAHHETTDVLCSDCAALFEYARARLDRCPFQDGKTTCAKCPIHCYEPAMRERIRLVMRYAGPRMLTRHPLLALRHLVDSMRDEPLSSR